MFCSQCGMNNADNAAFCAGCGAPLANEQPVAQEAPQQPEAPVVQQPQGDFQPSYTPTPSPELPGKGMGIAGMILGIASLVLMCYFYIALPCAIVGLILSCSANGKAKKVGMKNGCAVAGIITSSIGLGLGVIYLLLAAIGFAAISEMGYDLEDFMEYIIFHKFF